jgi:hypothetical protein
MIIDVVLLTILLTILIVGYFLLRAVPLLWARAAHTRHHRPPRLRLLEERLHETESREAVTRAEPFPGATATFAAAKEHIALADAYKDEWHRLLPHEPPAHAPAAEAPRQEPPAAA